MPDHSSEFEELLVSPTLVARLYANSLVIIDEALPGTKKPAEKSKKSALDKIKVATEASEQQDATTPNQPLIPFLGEFGKKIGVFVEDASNPYLPEDDFELLTKMLQAVKCSVADIALVNVATQPLRWQTVEQQLAPEQAIFFGVDPFMLGVPMRIQQFRVHRWGRTSFLCSPALAELNTASEHQTQLKKDLWKALQEMFA